MGYNVLGLGILIFVKFYCESRILFIIFIVVFFAFVYIRGLIYIYGMNEFFFYI